MAKICNKIREIPLSLLRCEHDIVKIKYITADIGVTS